MGQINLLRTVLTLSSLYFGLSIALYNGAHADTLTILNWEKYLAPEVVTAWEAKTGHTIKQIYFDNDETRNAILVRSEQEGIDIALMDQPSTALFGNSGKFVPVEDYSQTNQLHHVDSLWRSHCGSYALPYLWGTFGLVYRKDIFKEKPPTSWAAIMQPAEHLHNHIAILKDSVDTFAPALLAKNLPINTANRDLLKQAFDDTKALMAHILTFEYPITYVASNTAAEDLYLAVAYSGDQIPMNANDSEARWAYTVPEEGTLLWVDCFAITDKSANKALAFDFINYISEPKVAALNSEILRVATANSSAKKLQSEAFKNDHSVYPPQAIIDRGQHYAPTTPENFQLRNRMASALLKIHESK